MYKYFIAFVLLLPSVCFGQEFNVVIDSDQYPTVVNNSVIPLHDNQAILSWRLEPRGGQVVDASIISSFTGVLGVGATSIGWVYAQGTIGVDGYTQYYSVIDKSTFFSRGASSSLPAFITDIQAILSSKGLGTVEQRQAYINQLHGTLDLPQLIDPGAIFQGVIAMLQPYAVLMISIFGSIFILGRCLKIFEANINARRKLQVKIEKRAERTAQLNDQEFGRISFNLDMLAAQYKETGSRADRRAYREAFNEYAAYKESKGWKY